MTAQLLASELHALIQDTRRKSPDIKNAAERSLAELRALSNTSESQLAADLRRRTEFVRPFLLACKAANQKYASSSIISLQRLIAANGLAPERLEDVLESLRSCSSLGTDIQLRVLQIMPTLFQKYGDRITESRLAIALQACFMLQASTNAMISNTAAATLQQIINDIFARLGSDKRITKPETPESTRISWQAELDCHQVLQDLCSIAEGKPVRSLEKTQVPKERAFELVGTILLEHTSVVSRYTNFVNILRQQLLPLTLKIVSSSSSFSMSVRALRLIPPMVCGLLEALPIELEMLLSMLLHMLEPDVSAPWKRSMCMEVVRDVYKEPANVRRMYALLDRTKEHKPLVREQLNMLSRIALEKPALIGFGQNSSIPTKTMQVEEDLVGLAATQADALTATTGVSLVSNISTNSGISMALSGLRVSLIDQLDKSDPPSVPPTYIYALDLTCINNISEGLARCILPFAASRVPSKEWRRSSKPAQDQGSKSSDGEPEDSHLPVNPLDLRDHKDYDQICVVASLLEDCWPALLSGYSTFFQAALDAEYYHTTIRAFQKLTQVTTLLRLGTPRDAFLTALAKQALPNDMNATHSQVLKTTTEQNEVQIVGRVQRPSARNLLCLRALLNLGIALAPILHEGWGIVLKALQQADIVIGQISPDRIFSQGGPASIAPATAAGGDHYKDFGTEFPAVQSAASRMLRTATELPTKHFVEFLLCLTSLFEGLDHAIWDPTNSSTPNILSQGSSYAPTHAETSKGLRGNVFVIDAISQLVNFGQEHFAADDPGASGLDILIDSLLKVVHKRDSDGDLRLAAAETICKSIRTATSSAKSKGTDSASLASFGFATLKKLIARGNQSSYVSAESRLGGIDANIHYSALQTLRACLDEYGESINRGWDDVCDLVLSAFAFSTCGVDESQFPSNHAQPLSNKLLRSSFESLRVICSDLLTSFPNAQISKLLHAVYLCCHQDLDLNISLAATALYQNLSDHLWSGQEQLDIDQTSSAEADHVGTVALGSLWLQILDAICEATTNEKSEIRNSAVHACFRIFDTIGDKLQPKHWVICMDRVLLRLLQLNEDARSSETANSHDLQFIISRRIAYDETAGLIHDNICALLDNYLAVILEENSMSQTWDSFVGKVAMLLTRKSLTLSASVYGALTRMLSGLDQDDDRFEPCIQSLWRMWSQHNPHDHIRLDQPPSTDNQPALIAYVSCSTELMRVSPMEQKLPAAKTVLQEVVVCLARSSRIGHLNDVHTLTSLQSDCRDVLETIWNTVSPEITYHFMGMLANLIKLPHAETSIPAGSKGPTFVALADIVMTLITRCVSQRVKTYHLYTQPTIVDCFRSLCVLVQEKRVWMWENKAITLWKHATNTTIELARTLLPLSLGEEMSQASSDLWDITLDILDAALGEGSLVPSESPLAAEDLYFEIETSSKMIALVVPSLGSRYILEDARRRLARVLFIRSLIHEPHPDDALEPGQEPRRPDHKRIGRVRDLPPNRRSKLCYLLVDQMFALVLNANRSEDHHRLAMSTAPFLLLRTQLVLKAYIADQPLRGRMPCPLSQKRELIYLLEKNVNSANAEAEGDPTKKFSMLLQNQMCVLRALAITALRVTKWDGKIKEALLHQIEIA